MKAYRCNETGNWIEPKSFNPGDALNVRSKAKCMEYKMRLNINEEILIRNIIQRQLELMDYSGNIHNMIDVISWEIKDKLEEEFNNAQSTIDQV